jgi:hypothetical protein
MTTDRLTWILERVFYYSLMFILLVSVIFSLSNDYFQSALILFVLFIIVLYKGLVCISIRANSLVLREGKVVFLIPEKSVRNRFDFVSRGQTIYTLPHYSLLDHPYKLEIFSPDNNEGLYACRLSLQLGYNTELTALQRAYDSIILHQDLLKFEVSRLLLKCLGSLTCPPASLHNEEAIQEYLKPLAAELNLGLESVGLKITEANCSFSAGPALVRFVAAEQAIFENESLI